MKWAVEIQNLGLERRNLSDLLAGLGYELVDCVDFEAFTSPLFDQYDTAGEVWSDAKWLREAFTGPAAIDPEFILGSVIDCSTNDYKRHVFVEVEGIAVTALVGKVTITNSPSPDLTEDELADWRAKRTEQEYQAKLEAQREKLEPAFREPRASKVLALLAKDDHTGETLYKLYELMEEHYSKREVFQGQFGVSKDEFRRFGDAVHNPKVSGDLARHAYGKEPKTKNPMSIHEAETFVRQLAKMWLASVRASEL